MIEQQRNWAGNYAYSTDQLHYPETVEQVQQLVASGSKLRVLGTRHSFNSIADSNVALVSLARLNRVLAIDGARRTVTIEGGIRYGELGQHLHREGYALHNMASLPHISVVGACATATHGSGDANANLAAAVAAIEFVAANGELVALSREQHGEQFQGAVVNLGGLGVVTKITLEIEPTYQVQQDVYEFLPLAQLEAHFDQIVAGAYSVSLFTDWNAERISQVWLKRRVTGDDLPPAPAFFGASHAPVDRHPIREVAAVNCTPQGVPGPWHERLPHFRMEFTPSNGEELQSEYFVPRQHAVAAIRAVGELRERVAPLLLVSEIRTIAADTLWMSPCYGQPCIGIHFTWKQDWPAVRQLLPRIEERLAPFEARPHWGKLFTTEPARLQALYPRLADFRELLRSYDPQGRFQNEFLATYIGA